MLRQYVGVLMADALAQYDAIVSADAIIRLFCWAHVRRDFDAARHLDPRCHEMLILITKRYVAERRAEQRRERQ